MKIDGTLGFIGPAYFEQTGLLGMHVKIDNAEPGFRVEYAAPASPSSR
jgi:hypothetical protein